MNDEHLHGKGLPKISQHDKPLYCTSHYCFAVQIPTPAHLCSKSYMNYQNMMYIVT